MGLRDILKYLKKNYEESRTLLAELEKELGAGD